MSPLTARAGRRKREWSNSGMGLELAAGLDETLGGFREIDPQEGATRGHHQVDVGRDQSLVAAVKFAQPAFGAGALNGIAHRSLGGHHAHAGGSGRLFRGAYAPIQQKGPAIHAATLFANGAEFTRAPQALPGAESHH